MMSNLAIFHFRCEQETLDKAWELRDQTRVTSSCLCQLAFEKWLAGDWEPAPHQRGEADLDGQAIIYLSHDLMKRLMEHRKETGMALSNVARDALRRWTRGEFKVVLDEPQ